MRINVLPEQKTYLLPFSIGSKYHFNRDFISKEDINYVLFDDIDIQFKKVVDNPQDYVPQLLDLIKSVEHKCIHSKTKDYLDFYFSSDYLKDTVLTFN